MNLRIIEKMINNEICVKLKMLLHIHLNIYPTNIR